MKTKPRLINVERDQILADAMNRARNAMMLLQGMRVGFETKASYINFEKEILKLTHALQVLGCDASIPVSFRSERTHQVVNTVSRFAGRRQLIT